MDMIMVIAIGMPIVVAMLTCIAIAMAIALITAIVTTIAIDIVMAIVTAIIAIVIAIVIAIPHRRRQYHGGARLMVFEHIFWLPHINLGEIH